MKLLFILLENILHSSITLEKYSVTFSWMNLTWSVSSEREMGFDEFSSFTPEHVVPGLCLWWKEKCRKCLCPQRILKIAVEMLNWDWFWCLPMEERRDISHVNRLLLSWMLPCLLFLYPQLLFRILHSACNAKWINLNRKSDYVSIKNNNKKNPNPNIPKIFHLGLLWTPGIFSLQFCQFNRRPRDGLYSSMRLFSTLIGGFCFNQWLNRYRFWSHIIIRVFLQFIIIMTVPDVSILCLEIRILY